MDETRVLYYGGLWPTNMGNSFIDIGAMYLLKETLPEAKVYQASRFSRFYAQHRGGRGVPWLRNDWQALDVAAYADVDYVVVAGNVTHTDFIRIEGPTIQALVKRGAKFVVLGGGCSIYTRGEYDAFRDFMRSVDTFAFVARDQTSYDVFNGAARFSYSGIDCAFFLSDALDPMRLCLDDYVVCTFDDQEFEKGLDLKGETVVRARHYSFGVRERLVKKLPDTLVSDIPHDYIYLYAGAKATYSDRVHACVATLAFGHEARLFSSTPRAQLFAEVGAGDILTQLTKVDEARMAERKAQELAFLSQIFGTES